MTSAPGGTSAIVLAGGRSSRFGSDKLVADVGGAPLLHHAIGAVSSTCDEVIVVLPLGELAYDLPSESRAMIRTVRDVADHPGPLAGLLTGAHEAAGSRLLVVAGDMPSLQEAVLLRMLSWTHGEGACLHTGGGPQVLPLALGREAAISAAEGLLLVGEHSLRALVARLDLELIPESEWRPLDPDGATLRDVDRPQDLDRPR